MVAEIHGRALDRSRDREVSWSLSLRDLEADGPGYRGRPLLTERLRPGLQAMFETTMKSTAIRGLADVRYYYRFLDHLEALSDTLPDRERLRIDDLEWSGIEATWRQFMEYIGSLPASRYSPRSKYYLNSTITRLMLAAFQTSVESGPEKPRPLDVYNYFASKRSGSYGDDTIDFEEAKRAFTAMMRSWRRILARIKRARDLASAGTDPATGSNGANRYSGGGWSKLENRFWFTLNRLPFFGIGRNENVRSKALHGLAFQLPEEFRLPDVDNGTTGVCAHAGALFLTANELYLAFAMVSIKTGMNPDSIARQRLGKWCVEDALHPDTRIVITGPKRKGDHRLRAVSSVVKKTDAYQIISEVVRIQEPLRNALRAAAETENDGEAANMAELVWIAISNRGITNLLPDDGRYESMHASLDAFFAAADVTRNDGTVLKYRVSMGRDLWGLFVYHRSGYNALLAAQALGHASLSTLLHYIEKKSLAIADRKRLVDLQERVLTDLTKGEFVLRRFRENDPQVAATGLLCVEPMKPTPEADPGNGGGRICAAQRCWACHNWYATRESLPYLLKAIEELEALAETISLALWQTSDYPMMLEVWKHIVGKFHASHVDAARASAASLPALVTPGMFVGRSARRES